MASPGEQSHGPEAAAAAPADNATTAVPAESGASAAPSGPIDYAELYDQIKGKPCKVERINQERIGFREGDFRTRSDIIERELAPIYNANTLEEVHQELEAAHKRLSRLGVFSSVSFLAHEEPLVGQGSRMGSTVRAPLSRRAGLWGPRGPLHIHIMLVDACLRSPVG